MSGWDVIPTGATVRARGHWGRGVRVVCGMGETVWAGLGGMECICTSDKGGLADAGQVERVHIMELSGVGRGRWQWQRSR